MLYGRSGTTRLLAAAALTAIVAVACGSGTSGSDGSQTPAGTDAGAPSVLTTQPAPIPAGGSGGDSGIASDSAHPVRPALTGYEQFTQRNEENGLTTILATTDLGVGTERFAFVLTEENGLVKFPVVNARTYFYPDGYEGERVGPVEQKLAAFQEFPFGTRGVYAADYNFDRAGEWGIEVTLPRPDGSIATTEHRFDVKPRTEAPDVGDRAPASHSRTLANVASIKELTTGSTRDPALYKMSIADALGQGRPFTVTFNSPAFCTTPVCGPQVDIMSELAAKYGDDMEFIHVDLFTNPEEIQGDLDRAVRSPILDEWGIVTDEWTFVVNGSGRVSGRFEGFSPYSELEETIVKTLG